MVLLGHFVLWSALQPPAVPPAAIYEAASSGRGVEEAGDASTEPAPSSQPVPTGTPLPPAETSEDPPPGTPAQPEVEMPEHSGRGLIIGAIVAGTVGWASSAATTALAVSDCSDCGGAPYIALIGLRWTANGAAAGMGIPAGILRGRYHAAAGYLGEDKVRNPKPHILAGATTLGLGSALWAATRLWGAIALVDSNTPGPEVYVAYFASLQVGWTAASTGAGLLSYGVSLKKGQKRLGRLGFIHVAPQLGLHDAGLSIVGRF